jgi:DNA polymerase-4/DNA polymerase V
MKTSPHNLFLHADGDSFFVACEVAKEPQYKGKPVVVGGDRGVAVAMSAEAKKLGVTRGMPVFQIKRDFPTVIVLPHNFDLYNHISRQVYEILCSYLSLVEIYSIDECFALVKPSDVVFAGSPEKLLTEIKHEIQETCGVTYSFGLARTKALAKTASKLNKPNGLVMLLDSEDEKRALCNTAIEDVWGIGRKTTPRLTRLGIKTAYDFVSYERAHIEKSFSHPLIELQRELSGESLYALHDHTDPRDQKSLQSTATFKPSSCDPRIIMAELSGNIERACERARGLHLMTKNISFFVKNTDFAYRFADVHLPLYTSNPSIILDAIEPILATVLKRGEKIRSTGVTLRDLRRAENVPRDLFGTQEASEQKNIVDEVADKIREKFGHGALKRASSLKSMKHNRGNSFPKAH